jgi:hypothetical protein
MSGLLKYSPRARRKCTAAWSEPEGLVSDCGFYPVFPLRDSRCRLCCLLPDESANLEFWF